MKATVMFFGFCLFSFSLLGQDENRLSEFVIGEDLPIGEFVNHAPLPSAQNAASASIQLDSIVDARVSNGNWMLSDKYVFFYNVNGELLSEIESYWKNSKWNLDQKNEFEYDAKGNMTQRLEYYADSILWVVDEKNTFTYDANNNMLEWLRLEMNNGVWQNDRRIEYGYNPDDNMIYSIRQYWDGAIWENSEKVEFAYNSSKQLIQELEFDWQDTVWKYSSKSENTLDAQGKILIQVDSYWQDSIWVYDDKDSNIYNSSDQLIENYRFYWSAYYDEWRVFSLEEFTYDAKGNITESLNSNYSSGQWLPDEKTMNVFDAAVDQSDIWLPKNSDFENDFFSKSKIDASKYFAWGNSTWEMEDSTAFYYSPIPFGIDENDQFQVLFYPNPTLGRVFIKADLGSICTVTVHDILGNELLKVEMKNGDAQIDTSSWPNGVYLFSMKSEKGRATQRIIKH